MSDTPSYASAPLATARQPLSAAALTSFILSLLLCVPLLTSLTAICFAFAGFKATRNAARSGRAFAITGLILGILGLLFWSTAAAGTAYFIHASEAPRATLHAFARNAFTGNLPAAAADCDSAITTSQLEGVQTYIAPFGTYSDLTCTSINFSTTLAGETCQLTGTAQFSSGTHYFTATLTKSPAGAWKVYNFHIY